MSAIAPLLETKWKSAPLLGRTGHVEGAVVAGGKPVSPLAVSLIAFAVIFGGAFLGVLLRRALPGHHLDDDAKDVVRLGTGLISTIAALVLGLVIARPRVRMIPRKVKSSTLRLISSCSTNSWRGTGRRRGRSAI